MNTIFQEGAISPLFIGETIAAQQSKINTGAHNIFLGQVRGDLIGEKKVLAIDYTAYKEMAEGVLLNIKENAFKKFDLTDVQIYHSLGKVKIGEICLFVMACSKHRDISYKASRYIVEEIKANVPIFGKELFEDSSHQWKVNK